MSIVRRIAPVVLGALTVGLVPAAALAERPVIPGALTFTPLSASADCAAPSDDPFVLPAGFGQQAIESETADPDFDDLPDMNQLNETGREAGRFLFRTHEVGVNGSLSVTDLLTGDTSVVAQRADWERLDGLKWTPWQTLLAAEEVVTASLPDPDVPGAESGLLYEIAPWSGVAVARPAVGSVSHEGIGLDPAGRVYVIDEFADGAIFRFEPDRPGDLSSGRLFALAITNEAAAPGDRTGAATWLPLDRQAVRVNARYAALAVGATTYGRPEDVEVVDNVLYVAITSEDRVLAVDLKGPAPFVTDFVRAGLNVPVEIDPDGGSDLVSGFANPDNLAVDRSGNLLIAEDNKPGDIWAATPDLDGDHAADTVSLFASLADCGAEPTGIYVGRDADALYVNVQHAGDGDDRAMRIERDR